ncbi:YolD-like family protein [Brevibacillus porteri]|uniref:YolD-like family protein n=1 Tax=Brevibacillus porteri TaxID=2126350 RepID=UPI003D1A33D4
MRFVLPEQRELYLQVKEDDKLITMPIVEQDELESLNYVICDSARADYAITVTWWKQVKGNLGTICTMWGVVKWIDQNGRRINSDGIYIIKPKINGHKLILILKSEK